MKTKKNKNKHHPDQNQFKPEQVVEFIESFRSLLAEKDEPTIAISLRVPANLLRALKSKAKIENKKYQSLIIELIRNGLKN